MSAPKIIGLELPERAISLSWPWTHFMLELPESIRKTVENRKRGFSHKSFRGPCWVHVTPPRSKVAFYEACEFAMARNVPRDLLPSYSGFPGSGIVGRWNVTGVLPVPDMCELPDGWRMINQFAFTVAGAELVPFAACKGHLGFWRVLPETIEAIRAAIPSGGP